MTATATTTTTAAHLDPARRHDFVLFFDVSDGNPNGDPDAGNLPRIDPETMQGLVTDVALKRKIRDWVDLARGGEERFKIYVQNREALNDLHQRAYTAEGLTSKGSRQPREDVDKARAWMCNNFYDVRTFGAVMSTGVNAGQVRGPIQLTFARSIDPIVPLDVSITRIAITRPEDMQVVTTEEGETTGKTTEMGRKSLVPYGLYRGHGFFVPAFAERTGFSSEDLELFWQALLAMWDIDRSASRGMVGCRGLYIFSHDSKLGNAPAQALFDRIVARLNDGVVSPRRFSDYTITIDTTDMPTGVTLTQLG
ncbi:MAG: type I-C CRISPR-associated protein Cas7/Csd2 [Chloroflexi bacterium]|nr:MAG: type I-C CRISPR-associated protein Cas7/Csd2 [Chloroflexota bacterium]